MLTLGDVIIPEPVGKSIDVLEQPLVDGDEARGTEIEGGPLGIRTMREAALSVW